MVSAALPEPVAPRVPHESTCRTAERPYRYDPLFQTPPGGLKTSHAVV